MNKFLSASALLVSLLYLFPVIHSQTFTRITQGQFVNDGGASRSVNFIDYDNDGDIDLFVSNGKRYGQFSFLYQNNSGSFARITNLAVTQDSLPYDGASWADIDNDGDLDLCVVTWYDSTNMLYVNNGGTFTLLSSSPVFFNRGFSETCSWGDYNNDGLIDLFVTNSAGVNNRNWLYKNLGSNNFERIDSGAIFSDVNYESRGMNWVDIDNDGDLDIFVCNESGQNEFIYKNQGGFFTKELNTPPVTSGGNSWSSSWGDYDNDGDFDLFVANTGNQTNLLFRNDGDFNFSQITNDTIVKDPGYFACSGWGDYDNDGDLDMFVTEAYRTPNSPLKNMLYRNKFMETGVASFEKISTGDIVNDAGYSYGFSWGDWDRDGDLDIFIAKTYGENENNAAYLNDGNSNKWLEVKCIGESSNKSAIGAKVRVKAVINSSSYWQVREIDGQSGYCGQNLDLHFGLGNALVIDSIQVEWPSGTIQRFSGVQVNQYIVIDEIAGIIGIQKINQITPKEFILYQNYPNPFNPVTKIQFSLPGGTRRGASVQLTIYDIMGRKVALLVNEKLVLGTYEVNWNASNYASGMYFYTLSFAGFTQTRKMVLLK